MTTTTPTPTTPAATTPVSAPTPVPVASPLQRYVGLICQAMVKTKNISKDELVKVFGDDDSVESILKDKFDIITLANMDRLVAWLGMHCFTEEFVRDLFSQKITLELGVIEPDTNKKQYDAIKPLKQELEKLYNPVLPPYALAKAQSVSVDIFKNAQTKAPSQMSVIQVLKAAQYHAERAKILKDLVTQQV